MLPKAVVACFSLTLFSTGSQGNKEANVYNHHLAAGKERFLRFVGQPAVFRRDLGSGSRSRSEACLPESREYYRRLRLLQCDSEEYIRAVMSEIETSSCNLYIYNNSAFSFGCGTNHNGDVCTGILDNDSIYEDCEGQLDCDSRSDCKCSSECQTELRHLCNSDGCCIHANEKARMPSLWMNCNIQQPEVCADTPNITDIFAKRNVDSCTYECNQRHYFYQFCKHLGERYEELNRECGYEDVIYQCEYDKGHFCNDFNYLYPFFRALHGECYSEGSSSSISDGVCSSDCKNFVEELVDRLGCCVKKLIDDEDLLSACGIEAPDACTSFNSTAVPDDYLECTRLTINNNSGADLQSGVYTIGVIGLIAIYIL